jgi:hypothetical protein
MVLSQVVEAAVSLAKGRREHCCWLTPHRRIVSLCIGRGTEGHPANNCVAGDGQPGRAGDSKALVIWANVAESKPYFSQFDLYALVVRDQAVVWCCSQS